MNNFFRAIIAGYGAKKLGGGCFGTILVFILIWVALGQCSFSSKAVPVPETFPDTRRTEIQPPDDTPAHIAFADNFSFEDDDGEP